MPIAYTVDLTCCGRVWTASAGDVEGYAPGLSEPSVVDAIDVVASVPAEQSVSFEAVFDGLDIPSAVASGYTLASATAVVRVVDVGDDGVVSQVLATVSGPVRGIQWGDPSRSAGWMAGTVEAEPWQTDATILSPGAVMCIEAWPGMNFTASPGFSAAKDGDGKPYPWVWGTPGEDGSGGSPAYVCRAHLGPVADALLIAGHRVSAPRVEIMDAAGAVEVFSVTNEADGLGRIVATVDITGATVISTNTEQEFWALWTYGPAQREAYSIEGMSVIGALADMLLLAGYEIDMSSFRRASAAIPIGWSGYINDPDVTVWDIIQRHILPVYPVSLRVAGSAMQAVVIDAPRPEQTVADVVEGHGWDRISPAQVEREISDVESRVTLVYDGGASQMDMETAEQLATVQVLRSRSRRASTETTITAEYVWGEHDAASVLLHIARSRGVSISVARYQVDPEVWGWIQPGEAVSLTDSGIGLEGRPVMVIERGWPGDGTEEILAAWWDL